MSAAPDKRPAFEPASQLLQPTRFDPEMKRPATTVAGAVLVFLRVLSGILLMITLAVEGFTGVGPLEVAFEGVQPEVRALGLAVVLVAIGVFLLIDGILALFVLRGHNWARVIIMTFSAISITAAFVQWWAEGQEITITTTLLSLGLDILILLALSSRSAAAYARRNERR